MNYFASIDLKLALSKFFVVFFSATVLVFFSSIFSANVAHADSEMTSNESRIAVTGEWASNSHGWRYVYSDGTFEKGLKEIGNATYFFDKKGWMKTGWQKISGSWYYFGAKNDGSMKTGWKKISGKWYFMNSDGKMLTGKQTIGKATYFLASSGVMRTGWIKEAGKWYYCNSSGSMAKGWKKVGGAWYYLNSDGKMLTGRQSIGKATYFLASSGVMKTGWVKNAGKWYYCNPSGAMRTNAWISGKYWVGSDGVMATNEWVDGGKYYVDRNGVWVKNKKGMTEREALQVLNEFYTSRYSYKELVDELVFMGSSYSMAIKVVKAYEKKNNVDWNERAYLAISHGGCTDYSLEEQISILEKCGFTHEQAVYGAEKCQKTWKDRALSHARSLIANPSDRDTESMQFCVSYSRSALIKELTSQYLWPNKYAVYAADNCGANWNEQALIEARYITTQHGWTAVSGISEAELLDTLVSDGFTQSQASYAVVNCGADWNEMALKRAKRYQSWGDSKSVIQAELGEDGFAANQIEYAIKALGL